MPVLDAAPAFAESAAQDGIELVAQPTVDWFTESGHLGFERAAINRRDPALKDPVTAAVPILSAIYARLGGDPVVLRSLRANYFLTVDLAHEPTGTLIELDESKHFTSFRLQALELYPPDATLGFDIEEYRELCREWSRQTDNVDRAFAAKGFGFGGRQRERAYRDSLLDLGASAMGLPPVRRVIALDGDGAAAYEREREPLAQLLKTG
ncbi:MAG TPA: hypothetical protein VG186_09305 [Solirubrobacteraceae bacterium]|nr:hypothetical protein [Solirubrobacteraceae bacterium]